MYKKLLDKIKQYNKITLFRHQRPDGDAVFTILALYEFIRTNFPEKKVKCCGYDLYSKKNKIDKVSDSFIKSSLAIVIDTSRSDRIDDDRFALAEYIIKIDHHPVVDSYGNLNIVKTDVGACAELLAEILMSKTFSKYKISNKVYEYLYSGIVTDTLNLKTASTTPKTLKIASKLAEKGNLIISNIVDSLMDNSIDEFQKISKLRNHLKIDKNFGYIILHNKDLKEIGFDPYEAKNNISEFGSQFGKFIHPTGNSEVFKFLNFPQNLYIGEGKNAWPSFESIYDPTYIVYPYVNNKFIHPIITKNPNLDINPD